MTTANILSQLGSPGVSTGFKNRIINGAMQIDQRNGGASVSLTSSSDLFVTDRWQTSASQNGKITAQQNAGSVTPPAGFTNYLGFTSQSAYSLAAGDYFFFKQIIEGYNAADLSWGTANGKTVTLSFQVYSSLTGTFGGAIRNSAGNQNYPFTYTVSSASTWTSISITIPAPTSGSTWLTTNGQGVFVVFSLGIGTTLSGPANAWSSSNYYSATGATSVVGTNGATFYITGVQFEVGTTATNFDYRSIGTEFSLCQRYYTTSFQADGYPASPNNLGVVQTGLYTVNAADTGSISFQYPVPMRTAPTVTFYAPLTSPAINNIRQASNGTITAGSAIFVGYRNFSFSGGSANTSYQFGYTASAEL